MNKKMGKKNLSSSNVLIMRLILFFQIFSRTILAIAITGTCSKDSLLSWIRFLEKTNPNLANLSILFATNSPLGMVPLILYSALFFTA